MKKNLTEMVFILDRSGSMAGLEADTIGGFNSMIERQKKEEGEAYVSTVLFFACLVAIAFGGGMLAEIAERGDMSELLSTTVAGPLVYVGLGVAAGLCEIRYYNRRDHLFVN